MNPFNENYLIENINKRNKLLFNYNNNYNNENCGDTFKITLHDYLIAYAENMSYIRSNSISIVICTFSLSYVQDTEQVMSEIYRILKPVSFFYEINVLLSKSYVFILNL